MIYTPLTEPVLTYHHTGMRSPLLLQVEAIRPAGSFRLLEFLNRRPVIQVDGSQDQARKLFAYVCESLKRFLDDLNYEVSTTWEFPPLYEIDLRRDGYRFLLAEHLPGSFTTFHFGAHDTSRVLDDLQETSERLLELYSIHYGIE